MPLWRGPWMSTTGESFNDSVSWRSTKRGQSGLGAIGQLQLLGPADCKISVRPIASLIRKRDNTNLEQTGTTRAGRIHAARPNPCQDLHRSRALDSHARIRSRRSKSSCEPNFRTRRLKRPSKWPEDFAQPTAKKGPIFTQVHHFAVPFGRNSAIPAVLPSISRCSVTMRFPGRPK